jgi:hypothetical protein
MSDRQWRQVHLLQNILFPSPDLAAERAASMDRVCAFFRRAIESETDRQEWDWAGPSSSSRPMTRCGALTVAAGLTDYLVVVLEHIGGYGPLQVDEWTHGDCKCGGQAKIRRELRVHRRALPPTLRTMLVRGVWTDVMARTSSAMSSSSASSEDMVTPDTVAPALPPLFEKPRVGSIAWHVLNDPSSRHVAVCCPALAFGCSANSPTFRRTKHCNRALKEKAQLGSRVALLR